MIRKVYISGDNPATATAAAAELRRGGLEVVSSWHENAGPKIDPADREAWGIRAARNFGEIHGADALVLLASADHISGARRVPGGKFVEAGYALGFGLLVVVVGGAENGMMNAPGILHAADVPGLAKLRSA